MTRTGTVGNGRGKPTFTDARGGMALMVLTLVVTLMTVMLMPDVAMARQVAGTGAATPTSTTMPVCAGASNDPVECLPASRWNNLLNSVDSRQDPCGLNIFKHIGRALGGIGNYLITSVLGFSQFCWGAALGLSNFAASFDIQNVIARNIDHGIAGMKDSLLNGNLVTALAVLGIFTLIGTRIFRAGETKSAAKRLGVTVVCLALLSITCSAAALEGKDAATPVAGSPWWATKTINDTMNKLSVGIDFDDISSGSTELMAPDTHKGSRDCRDYLIAMHNDYDRGVKVSNNGGGTSSNVVKTINRLWEETQLRAWVTMQYGSPTPSNGVSTAAADNAKRAYCHVLDSKAHTPVNVQADLTQRELGLTSAWTSTKSNYLFDTQGFIDPYNSKVYKNTDKSQDFGDTTYRYRMAFFWETCTSNGGDDKIIATPGWSAIIKNMGDKGSGKITDTGAKLRPSRGDAEGNTADTALLASNNEGSITALCKTILTGNVFNRKANHVPNDGSGRQQKYESNDNDAAIVGWRFDFPNVDGSWSEVNLNYDNDAQNAAATTINYMYGNVGVNGFNAIASSVAGLINLIVWGFLSLVLILSKLSLSAAPLFLVMSFVAGMMPVGDNFKKAPIEWAKQVVNFSMVGLLITIIGNFATLVSQALLSVDGMDLASPVFTVLNGASPVLGMALVSIFFTQILKKSSPFSMKGMMRTMGGTSMVDGIGPRGMHAMRGMMHRGLGSLAGGLGARGMFGGRGRKGGYASNQGHTQGSGQSKRILDRIAEEQSGRRVPNIPFEDEKGFGKKKIDPLTKGQEAQLRDPDTIKGAYADWTSQREKDNEDLRKGAADRQAKWAARATKLSEKLPEALRPADPNAWAQKHARYEENLLRAKNVVKHGAGWVAATARNKPLRRAVRNGLGTVGKLGIGVAMMANPVSALAGMALVGSGIRSGYQFGKDVHKNVHGYDPVRYAKNLIDKNNQEYSKRQFNRRQKKSGGPNGKKGGGSNRRKTGGSGKKTGSPSNSAPNTTGSPSGKTKG